MKRQHEPAKPKKRKRPRVTSRVRLHDRTHLGRFRVTEASILDYDLLLRICRLISKGLPFDGVADYLGIGPTTWSVWLRRGEAYLSGGSSAADKKERVFGDFVLSSRKALALYRKKCVRNLHGGKDWVRWMTILERRDRANFSRNDQSMAEVEEFDPDDRFL